MAALTVAAAPAIAATAAEKCEAGKNGTAGKYAACMHKAQQKFVAGGQIDTAGYDEAVLVCTEKYSHKWQSLEGKADGACPSNGDESDVQDFLDACITSVEDALAGAPLLSDPVTCAGDLSTCNQDLGDCDDDLGTCAGKLGALKTGQTNCYTNAGTIIPCAGTGQDGEYQAGVAHSFTDNGDGTITDNITGLMWEKLSDDGTVHDKDNTYPGTDPFSKITALNGASFAGYTDWRLPNRAELLTLVNLGTSHPATFGAFNLCSVGCSFLDPGCSCTPFQAHWSSTTQHTGPVNWWYVHFADGGVSTTSKGFANPVRAVRGGL
ncbi:MAG TPA: DUF1566 domain-containing protein [Candidatus Limnocylindrales bacterium]|nr:DUF1566 domain-containing protein [Candidatus Limnocylindrales bacterium]